MLDPLFKALAGLMAWFYDLVPNYGIAIILLTLTVMLLLVPLTLKGTRSMLALQRLQPEMKKLQQKHKDDKQALNEAMMAFYKEHKINPLGGCLPMLMQTPVFIVLYNIIRGLTHKDKAGELAPKYISHGSALYNDLREAGGKMLSFGMDLARSAKDTTGADAIPYYLLIALVVATGYYQARQNMSRNPQAAQANAQMMMMQRFFPLMIGFISFQIPAGVVLYFLVSNLFRITQTALMYRLDPTLAATVAKEVKELDAKATEIERTHEQQSKGSSKATKPSGGNGNGAKQAPQRAGNGRATPPASQQQRKSRKRGRKRRR